MASAWQDAAPTAVPASDSLTAATAAAATATATAATATATATAPAALDTDYADGERGSALAGTMPDHKLMALRDAPVGGQAVLEGVMMRGVGTWAVAVRKPLDEDADEPLDEDADEPIEEDADEPLDEGAEGGALGAIEVRTEPLRSVLKRHRVLRLPLLRGVVALGESLMIGFRALEISANAQMPDEEIQIGRKTWAGTIVVALVLAVGLFFVAPVTVTNAIKKPLGSSTLFWIVEGLIRTGIFLGYLALLARVRDLRRVFEYHGAEHKTISCYEAQLPLTPANAARFSRLHPRCGTSFLLIVMVVSIFVFAPIGLHSLPVLLATRVLGVPLIAGISFELIKLAGRYRGRAWVRALMWPGLQLQRLTTREPDHDQLAVAIAALDAVLAVERPGDLTADELVGLEVVA